jgi:2-dehydropantoate 2-reductase
VTGRYIVIGVGAVGGTIGGCLHQAGHEVVLVARGRHLEALRSEGLRLATPAGTSELRVDAVARPPR